MESALASKNWVSGLTSSVLEGIHREEVNIAIFDRSTDYLKNELDDLNTKDFEFRSSGDIDTISKTISNTADLAHYALIKQDVKDLLNLFSKITSATNYRLFLATVNSNMCRKFHTDINDLRMLCTYKGPGTLWLQEDNINRKVAHSDDDDDCIVIDESRIQQVNTGSLVILKGALYPKDGTTPILHRSPAIEESGEKRILLRIDTDEFANF